MMKMEQHKIERTKRGMEQLSKKAIKIKQKEKTRKMERNQEISEKRQ